MLLTRFCGFKGTALSLFAGSCVLLFASRSLAQNRIQPDSSLGSERSRVVRGTGSQIDLIQGGARRGSALFHSFNDFNVELGGEASFLNPKGVRSILTRVTGPFRSEILGTLGVEGQADLVFLNPNGVYFGPQSRVDIAGSLFVSSDSALDLGAGVLFRADTSPVPSLLTMRVPVGVQLGGTSGAIANRGVLKSGKDLRLSGDRLNLSGEIVAGRDLSLRGNRVVIRERDRAFTGAAGRTLRIEGRDQVDIDVLQFPESGLFSGHDLLLRSAQPIVADAHFIAGRHLLFAGWKEEFGNVISRTDPVILANGNVTLGNYKGASLHILAGGSVQLNNVIIVDSGPVESTINPENQTKVNETLTYGDLASFEVSGFQLQKNKQGGLDQIPTQETIEIDGHQQATLDIRAGVDWETLGGLSNNLVLGEIASIPSPASITNSSITIDGNVRIDPPEGRVLLTNQFNPNNTLLGGAIKTQRIVTSVNGIELDAGNILILGTGDIDNLSINSSSFSTMGNSGQGGDITISSTYGNIKNTNLVARSASVGGTSGKGGNITVSSMTGNIENTDLRTFSNSDAGNSDQAGNIRISSVKGNIKNIKLVTRSTTDIGTAGKGGNITVSSMTGNIENTDFRTFSDSNAGDSSNAGTITISSVDGNINNDDLETESRASSGTSGQGGDISVSSLSGQITNDRLRTQSLSTNGNSGKAGNITVMSDSGKIKNAEFRSGSRSRLGYGNADQGGDIIVSSQSGHIENMDLRTQSSSTYGNSTQAGDIIVSSQLGYIKNIDLISSSSSRFGNSGRGGDITVSSKAGDIENEGLRASSASRYGNSSQGGDITVSSKSGDIRFNDNVSTFSFSRNKKASNSGKILVTANQGSIIGLTQDGENPAFQTFSIGEQGSGVGGNIDLSGRLIKNLELLTLSSNGRSGNVMIEGIGKLLSIQDVEITANAVSELFLFESDDEPIRINTDNTGTSGNITIQNMGDIDLNRVNIESDSNLDFRSLAGNISFTASGSLRLKESSISTNANRAGKAGNFMINADNLFLDNSQITATANQETITNTSSQGNININVERFLILQNESLISTEGFERANGGNITINSRQQPADVVLGLNSNGNGNDIIANAAGGAGGNITINSKNIFGFTRSQPIPGNGTNDINASSRTSLQGNIVLNTVDVQPNDNKPPLPESFNPPLVANTCNPGDKNSFVSVAQGGLKPKFEDITTPLWDDSRPIISQGQSITLSDPTHQAPPSPPISEAQGWFQDTEGNIQLIPPNGSPVIASHPSSCETADNTPVYYKDAERN